MTILEFALGVGALVYAWRRRREADDEAGLSRDQVMAKRSQESMADFMQHGPRLWVGRKCYVLFRSSDGTRVLLGGVGGMGIGRMWSDAGSHVQNDPTFADAPVDDDALDDFGENGRGERPGPFRPTPAPVVFSEADVAATTGMVDGLADSYRADPPAAWRGHRP